jgi:N-acetyl-alpha-D-muramate 1-phosphate uridylyltransferase
MRAMILAAGRGKRMGHLTDTVPKPLIAIAGKAMIVHHIERLRDAGITEIVINLAYRGAQIRDHLGNGRMFDVNIAYSEEAEGALDTGGGIAQALHLLGDDAFIVVNSDVWTDFDFASLRAPTCDAHLVLVPNPAHNRAGDFHLRDGKVVVTGAVAATFAGIGVYRPRLFQTSRQGRFGLAPLLREAAARDRVSGELFRGRWLDVGTAERLNRVKQIAAMHHPTQNPV